MLLVRSVPCGLRKGLSYIWALRGEPTSATLSLPTSSLGLILNASDVDPVLACAL